MFLFLKVFSSTKSQFSIVQRAGGLFVPLIQMFHIYRIILILLAFFYPFVPNLYDSLLSLLALFHCLSFWWMFVIFKSMTTALITICTSTHYSHQSRHTTKPVCLCSNILFLLSYSCINLPASVFLCFSGSGHGDDDRILSLYLHHPGKQRTWQLYSHFLICSDSCFCTTSQICCIAKNEMMCFSFNFTLFIVILMQTSCWFYLAFDCFTT